MLNKMIDMAICGRIVVTPEIHKMALEKYGILSMWQKIYLIFDIFRLARTNNARMEIVNDIFNKYVLNANKFDVSHDLYDVISKKYEEIFQVNFRSKFLDNSITKIPLKTLKTLSYISDRKAPQFDVFCEC